MAKQYLDEQLLQDIISQIKKIRTSKGITLEVFFFDTGIHLARIEQGKTNISISTLSKICNYFGIKISDFFRNIEK